MKAKESFEANVTAYQKAFINYHGSDNSESGSVLSDVIEEYKTSQTLSIRYLERDIKRLYLEPIDKLLLRPNLLDIPRPIDFKVRDKQQKMLKLRAEHQLTIINFLKVDG